MQYTTDFLPIYSVDVDGYKGTFTMISVINSKITVFFAWSPSTGHEMWRTVQGHSQAALAEWLQVSNQTTCRNMMHKLMEGSSCFQCASDSDVCWIKINNMELEFWRTFHFFWSLFYFVSKAETIQLIVTVGLELGTFRAVWSSVVHTYRGGSKHLLSWGQILSYLNCPNYH